VMTTVVAVANVLGYFNHDVSLTMMSPEERIVYQQTGEVNPELLRQTFGSLDPNDLAAVMATAFPLALWLATGSFMRRMIWTPCAMVMAVGVVPTMSRGGLLGLAAAAIVLILVGTRGFKRILMAGTLALGAVAFMSLAGDRIGNISGEDYNFTQSEGRIAIWKRGIVWTIKRPWGYGLNNFPYYFGLLNGPDRAAHNSLIQYSVELGVLGIGAYLMICASLVKSLLKIRRNAMKRGREGQELVTLSGHVLAMLAACWTTGFFLSNAYYPLTYMALGIGSAVVLSRMGSVDPATIAPAAPPVPVGPAGRRRRQFKAFIPA
jgi:O-antigen ligase